MKKSAFLLFAALAFTATNSFALVATPEIDPRSAVSGLTLVMSTAAFILERRRRR